ncbi:MAG: hypothetical protein WCE20_04310 [Rhizomicrobium sp.]
MKKSSFGAAATAMLLLLAGCGLFGHEAPRRPRAQDAPWLPAAAMLLVYVGSDGSLTRAQLESGLRRDFAAADTNHDGCLDANEVRAVNEQRWKQDASTASPLIDFQHNGCVDFDEFAATPRTLFEQLDRNGDGKLTADELKSAGAKPTKPQQGGQQQGGQHSRRRDGGGGNNPPGGGN